ncbi:hypothetical protein XENTR_v10010110 [Xenopus tropicalis]|nr:hypothetical protein XENTR_v10010110 [Xenopus tropicalis]
MIKYFRAAMGNYYPTAPSTAKLQLPGCTARHAQQGPLCKGNFVIGAEAKLLPGVGCEWTFPLYALRRREYTLACIRGLFPSLPPCIPYLSPRDKVQIAAKWPHYIRRPNDPGSVPGGGRVFINQHLCTQSHCSSV